MTTKNTPVTMDIDDTRNWTEGKPDSSGIKNIVKPFFTSDPVTKDKHPYVWDKSLEKQFIGRMG